VAPLRLLPWKLSDSILVTFSVCNANFRNYAFGKPSGLALYDNVRSRLNADKLHHALPFWRERAYLEVAIDVLVSMCKS